MISSKLRIPIFSATLCGLLYYVDTNRHNFKVQLSVTLSIYRGTKKGLASTERFYWRTKCFVFCTIGRERANDALIVSRMAKLNSVTRLNANTPALRFAKLFIETLFLKLRFLELLILSLKGKVQRERKNKSHSRALLVWWGKFNILKLRINLPTIN